MSDTGAEGAHLAREAWLIEYTSEGLPPRTVHLHNAVADFRARDPKAVAVRLTEAENHPVPMMRHAATRAHGICYALAQKYPGIPELQDDGDLHRAIHDIIAVEVQDAELSPAFKDATDIEIEAWLERHDLAHAIRGADARAAFEDAQTWVSPVPSARTIA